MASFRVEILNLEAPSNSNVASGSGSKTLVIPPFESKKSESQSTTHLSDLDDKMKSLADIVAELKKSFDTADEKSEERSDKLKRVAGTIKDLIGSVDHLAIQGGLNREPEEDSEPHTGQIMEAIDDLKQNFKVMEDRFVNLSKVGGDGPASNNPQTVA